MFENDDEPELPQLQKLPIYRQGMEIYRLASCIADLIEVEDPVLGSFKQFMLKDAGLLSAKIAGAEGGDLYDIRMENAALIRKAARDLLTHCHSLEIFGFPEQHYLHLLREALEEFRLLFREWVNTFDPWNYVYDSWGLFNPPGITENPGI